MADRQNSLRAETRGESVNQSFTPPLNLNYIEKQNAVYKVV